MTSKKSIHEDETNLNDLIFETDGNPEIKQFRRLVETSLQLAYSSSVISLCVSPFYNLLPFPLLLLKCYLFFRVSNNSFMSRSVVIEYLYLSRTLILSNH